MIDLFIPGMLLVSSLSPRLSPLLFILSIILLLMSIVCLIFMLYKFALSMKLNRSMPYMYHLFGTHTILLPPIDCSVRPGH